MVRSRCDEMGQTMIPVGLRDEISLALGDNLEVCLDSDAIILRKFDPKCVFCETQSAEMLPFKMKYICHHCRGQIMLL